MFRKRIAVLFIHGFVGGNYDYNNYPNELQINKKFDVFTFTLPGHDKLIVNNVKYNEWIEAAENQINFLINNNYKKIYVIGHSMGGVIATHLAATYKEVKKLVLVAPAFRYFYFKDGKVNIKNISETIKNMPDLIRRMGAEKVIERISKTPISTMLEFTKLVNEYSKETEKITCPTLIIHGLDDTVVPEEGTNYAYNTIKSSSSTLINIQKVNHDCFRGERNNEVKNIITNFLVKKNKKKKETLNI